MVGSKAAKRLAQAARPRSVGKEATAYFGWSRENHRIRLAGGHFPPPDGSTDPQRLVVAHTDRDVGQDPRLRQLHGV